MTTTLEKFGLETDPPRTRKVIGRCATWEEAIGCAQEQREKDPDTPVHIDPPMPDGRRIVYIEVVS